MHAGCEKLKIAPEGCQLVLEEDGTEIEEDLNIILLAGSTFILLANDQCWSNLSASTTSASEPEPTKASDTASQNTSKPLENILLSYSCLNN